MKFSTRLAIIICKMVEWGIVTSRKYVYWYHFDRLSFE